MAIGPRCLAPLGAAVLLAAAGCGGGRPPVDTSKAEVTVSGTVTVDGKPAAGNMISFDPSNVERKDAAPRSATIGEDGSYTITTLIGRNMVSFSGPLINQYPEIANQGTMHDLKAGENTLNFTLPEAPTGG